MAPGSIIGSVEGLPERYRGDSEGRLHARFRLKVGSLVRDVVVTPETCDVVVATGRPDATISTSPSTWHDLDSGRLSGIEAFATNRLTLGGSIQKALLFEPLFERAERGSLAYEVRRIDTGSAHISALIAGSSDKPPLVLLHGLGGTKASLLPIVPALAQDHQVIAVDLPGFGDSSKPRGLYDAQWFAGHVVSFFDALGIDSASVAGNSMGGRIAQELAMRHPDRVRSIVCLCPATAFSYRPGLPIVRLLPPELGVVIGRIPRRRVVTTIEELFARPSRLDSSWFEAAADDFLLTWRSPRARMAFFAAVRNIYLEEPYGEAGFWTRLRQMRTPALYIFGRQDVLITSRFGPKVADCLPDARVEVWDDCGHVPQIEHPSRTAELMREFLPGRRQARRAG